MSTTTATSAEIGAVVIPLQRAETDLPRRTNEHAAPWPHPAAVSFWDAELEACFTGSQARRPAAEHGRRCGCGQHPQPADIDVAS